VAASVNTLHKKLLIEGCCQRKKSTHPSPPLEQKVLSQPLSRGERIKDEWPIILFRTLPRAAVHCQKEGRISREDQHGGTRNAQMTDSAAKERRSGQSFICLGPRLRVLRGHCEDALSRGRP